MANDTMIDEFGNLAGARVPQETPYFTDRTTVGPYGRPQFDHNRVASIDTLTPGPVDVHV